MLRALVRLARGEVDDEILLLLLRQRLGERLLLLELFGKLLVELRKTFL